MPLGGSFVILTPFWRMNAGNAADGSDVSHSRKLACTRSGVSSSQMRSSTGIHATHRWQFCKHVHVPLSCASMMAASAMGP